MNVVLTKQKTRLYQRHKEFLRRKFKQNKNDLHLQRFRFPAGFVVVFNLCNYLFCYFNMLYMKFTVRAISDPSEILHCLI